MTMDNGRVFVKYLEADQHFHVFGQLFGTVIQHSEGQILCRMVRVPDRPGPDEAGGVKAGVDRYGICPETEVTIVKEIPRYASA